MVAKTPSAIKRKRAYSRKYYRTHRDELLAKERARLAEYRKTHPVKPRTRQPKAVRLAKHRAYYAAKRDYYRKKRAEWHRTHLERDRRRGKHHRLLRNFGITLADYERMLSEQGGRCAICGSPPGARSLHVDHCHRTGAVRGLLCNGCNSVLGHCDDDVAVLEACIVYLHRHRKDQP